MQTLAPASPNSLDPALSAFFLGRLAELVLEQMCAPTVYERTALAQVAFAIFLDCLDLGLGEEACPILGGLHIESAAERLVA